MRQRLTLLIVTATTLAVCVLILRLGLSVHTVSIPLAEAQVVCCEIETGNEDPVPGDWDEAYAFDVAYGAGVTRTTDHVHSGAYSYWHHQGGFPGKSYAWTSITCTQKITSGYFDLWVLFTGDVGMGDENVFASVGYWQARAWRDTVSLFYDHSEKVTRVNCDICYPSPRSWRLGQIITDTWHNFHVEWNTPFSSTTGSISGWQDGHLYFEATGLTIQPSPPWDMSNFGVGAQEWFTWSYVDDGQLYIDDVVFRSCLPPQPPPPPDPGVCKQYGHAAVLNVSDDECQAVLRFRTLPSYIPPGATVTRATLRIYGVAVEVPGETIYVTPLNALWGEMTTDWCRRLVGTDWEEPGAYNVPLDREPGTIANFETALGWIDIELPVGLVEEWALTGEANPGLIFHNVNLTGKFSIASREWHVEDYQPRINVWYTQ